RSPSEVAWTPRVSSTTTPARRSGGVGANRWAAYPQPTRTSVPRYTDGGSVPGGLDDRQGSVETLGSLLLVDLEGECQLGYQCHPGLRQHPLEGRADALRLLGVGEVSDDLRHLEDVSGSHLLVENLVPAAPVGAGFLGLLLQGLEDVAGCRLGDDRTDQVLHGVDRHHHRQLFGGDVEHVVVALLAIELLLDLFDDGGSPVLGMDDLVTYGELRFFGCHGELRGLSGLLGVTESNRAVSSIEIRVPGFGCGEQPIEESAELMGPGRADPFHLLELGHRGVEEIVETAEVVDESLAHVVGETSDLRQQPVPAGGGGVIELLDPDGSADLDRIVEVRPVELFERIDRLLDRRFS